MDLEPGNQIDRYTIEAIIGEGGMGRVCRAYDTRLRRRVALKVLLINEGGDSADVVASALREARAAAAIAHPNATAVYDADEIDGRPFIVMEYVPGTSLRQMILGSPVSLALRLRWLIDVACALVAAHQVGLVHRDIKPENVMVRDDGLVKVLDFGVARRTSSADSQTLNTRGSVDQHLSSSDGGSRLVGTPAYMSPEQIRGEPIDGRADQFAWGVLAYELLTRQLPWKNAREFLGYIAAVLTEKPESPRLLAPEIPLPVEAAILRALAKNPANRFSSMTAAVAELLPFAQDALSSSMPPAALSQSAPSRPRSSPSLAPPPSEPTAHLTPQDGGYRGRTAAEPPFDWLSNAPKSRPSPESASPSIPPPSAVLSGLPRAPSQETDALQGAAKLRAVPLRQGSSVPPPPRSTRSVPSVVQASGHVSMRRAMPDGCSKLHEPRFEGPVDVDAHLALLPADATCKGMFLIDALRVGARVMAASEFCRAANIPDRRYVAFHDYPASEGIKLLVVVARAVYPRVSLGEGLRRIGQTTFDAVLGTHVGRSLFGILGANIEQILGAAPKASKLLANFGRVTYEKTGGQTYLLRAREFPALLETYQIGVLEGVLRHCRVNARIRLALDDLATGTVEVRVG